MVGFRAVCCEVDAAAGDLLKEEPDESVFAKYFGELPLVVILIVETPSRVAIYGTTTLVERRELVAP